MTSTMLSGEHDVRNRNLIGSSPQALTRPDLIDTGRFPSGPVIRRAAG